jgi:hypothetical protein
LAENIFSTAEIRIGALVSHFIADPIPKTFCIYGMALRVCELVPSSGTSTLSLDLQTLANFSIYREAES